MRARRGLIVGWVVVGLYAGALVGMAATTSNSPISLSDDPTEDFIDAWERSRRATFVRAGTFERRSEDTGAAITSEDVLAQRPPRRLHRQLGGVDGRDDRRVIVCPAPPADSSEPPVCAFGAPSGPTYDASVDTEIAALRTQVAGRSRAYAVERAGDGCFTLEQIRNEPRAAFGIEARFCFDAATGAPTNSRVRYAGGIVEVVAVSSLTPTVSDADLDP